jgi:glutamate N-acetyltransferase/amino-acid N-acetyltransferase
VSVTAAPGFVAAGIASGIKASGAPDLALVAAADRVAVPAAAVFTTNLAAAAPVQVSRRHLADGHAAAVILNSGNANAATGEPGRRSAAAMCELTARALGIDATEVLVCSTGLIGVGVRAGDPVPIPMDLISTGIPKLAGLLGAGEDAGKHAARAILTTDTVRKEAVAHAELAPGVPATVGGMAKGAAMLAPAMATMLAVLTTDAAVEPGALHELLGCAVDTTFNALCVDACTSTNDTVIVLANGRAGNEPITGPGPGWSALGDALTAVCASLAHQMAADAEGATKLVHLTVRGARSRDDARRAARRVASSQLVQCSLYGADPYWGRVLSELGISGASFDPEQVEIAYNGIVVCRDGVSTPHDHDALAVEMAKREIELTCDLHAGASGAEMLFTDLTPAYIAENMTTS